MLTITGDVAPVTVNVYTNGIVIVNVFKVTEAISLVIVNFVTMSNIWNIRISDGSIYA